MSDATPAELQRLLAEEFERRGWDYDLNVVRQIIRQVEDAGRVDSAALAQSISADFLERQRTTRADAGDAIERALGGRVPTADRGPGPTTLIIHDHRYSLNMAGTAQISGGNVNVGGTQVNVQIGAAKEDVLAGVAALLRAGLEGDWNADAARELAALIEARDDVHYEEIAELAASVADDAEAKPGRIKSLLTDIVANAIGGAMGTGMSVGLGQVLSQLT